jgi:HSP20 family protein
MATQSSKSGEQQHQPSHGQAVARGSQQQGVSSRQYGLGIPLTPADFFRMNPFSLMRRMAEELDRAMGEPSGGQGERAWVPAIEVTQRDNNYMVRAELPGLKPEDVKLEITDDTIVLQGERKSEQEETKGGVHVTERRYGRFYRAIPLPEGAKADDARARFDNGVLEITVPTEEQRTGRRQIPIEGSSSGASSSGKPATSSGSAGGSEKAA